MSTARPPYAQKPSGSSMPIFLGGRDAVVIGGTGGKAHILSLESCLESLDHNCRRFYSCSVSAGLPN